MINSLIILFSLGINPPMKIDLGSLHRDQSWYVVNDGVMGGLSDGQVRYTDSTALWEGSISLDNNGGFSALRSDYAKYDLSVYSEVVIRYRSKGQMLCFGLYPYERFFMPYYKVDLGDTNGEWVEQTVPLTSFHKHILGRKYEKTLSRERSADIIRLGFINGGKKEGPFTFEIDYIEFR